MPSESAEEKSLHPLYPATVFLSSFLLFTLEPLIGKRLLPFFGGSTAVWATSLFVFTFLLFLGYAYAHLLSRLKVREQIFIHGALLILGGIAFETAALMRHSVFPSLDWTLGSTLPPVDQVVGALLASIGIPFFLLSATAPLLQRWLGTSTGKEPYHLYAISNAGSFVALGLYPFVIEPWLPLSLQGALWGACFVVCAALCAGSAGLAFKHGHARELLKSRHGEIDWREMLMWVLLTALPAALLVATTTELTQAISPIPFLWVLPLALYLLSFVIAFSGRGGNFGVLLASLASACGVFWFLISRNAGAGALLVDLAALFFVALACHAEAFRRRPMSHDSSLFYLSISFGGMLGTLAVALVAPLIFQHLWEFGLTLAGAALLVAFTYPLERMPEGMHPHIPASRITLTLLVFLALVAYLGNPSEAQFTVSRDFYGVVKVLDLQGERIMVNGTTLHGSELLDPAHLLEPTTFYGPKGGAGQAITYLQGNDKAIRFAGVGLGAGTLAAYCRPSDKFVFYEIDPQVEKIAQNDFLYLSHCAGAEVRLGDGRIRLSEEARAGANHDYDIIAVDAFSDDAIPTHLLTKEAFTLYDSRLAAGGLIVVHTSNRFLALEPVVARAGRELGYGAVKIFDAGNGKELHPSSWVILSKNPTALNEINASSTPITASAPLWTDDYSNVLGVVRSEVVDEFSKFGSP